MVAVRGLRPLHPRQHLRVLVWMRKHQLSNQYLYEGTMTKIDPLLEHAVRSNMRRIRETTSIDGKKPMSLRRMAEKIGATPVQLRRIETGKRSTFYHGLVVK